MALALEHVAKTHLVGPYEKRTLRDVSLTLAEGDVVGVYGNHRSGKSTLLRIAAGLEEPDSGRVRVCGKDLATLSASERGDLRLKQVGVVGATGPHNSELSVLQYVAFPLMRSCARGEARARAVAMLRRVDAGDRFDAKWRQLSDCERALVALAHGLVRQPELLLVDDPTGALNAPQQDEFVGLLRNAAAEDGVAVLMASSSMNALTGAHESYVLNDGVLKPIAVPTLGAEVVELPRRDETA